MFLEAFAGTCSEDVTQRTPWGGGKRRGVENLTNDTPPKKGFWTPRSYGTFSTPLRRQRSVFPVQKSTTEQTRSSFGGVQKFSGERILWYVFLPPYFLHPPISRPKSQGSDICLAGVALIFLEKRACGTKLSLWCP